MIAKRIARALRKAAGPHSFTYPEFPFENGRKQNLIVTFYEGTPTHSSNRHGPIEIVSAELDTNPGDPVDLSPDEEQRITKAIDGDWFSEPPQGSDIDDARSVLLS